jgi:hypothetical protein
VLNNPVRYVDPLGLECTAAPWDWDDCEDDAEEWVDDNVVEPAAEWVEDNVVRPAASATADFLSDPENVTSVVQIGAGAVMAATCPTSFVVIPNTGVCVAAGAVYGGATVAKFYLADSTHERIIVGVTGAFGVWPWPTPWGHILAGFSGALDALAFPTPAYSPTSFPVGGYRKE